MAATIEWSIETLEYLNDSDRIVTRSHWRCRAWEEVSDRRYATDNIGAVNLDDIKANDDAFVSYSDLTEAKCLDWTWSKIEKDEVEAGVRADLSELTSPALASGKPWS